MVTVYGRWWYSLGIIIRYLMYPNSIVAFNIFATTMIGKLYIFKFALEKSDDEDMGKEYIEEIISGDLDHIGAKWHNLPHVEDIALRLRRVYG